MKSTIADKRVEEAQSHLALKSTPPPPCPGVPQRVGRYQIVQEIASGGQASLYLGLARSTGGFNKAVAVKRMHPHLAAEDGFAEMFLDEARIASRLNHPNICGVFDFGVDDGCSFLVMDFLFGEPLSRVRRELSKRSQRARSVLQLELAYMIGEAARGLHRAHELREGDELINLVHRDVSPQNLFVTYGGTTQVLDFGIARSTQQSQQTVAGTIKGKFSYMSPEQLRGEADRRTDVWALGVVAWELLTGARLFRRENDFLSAKAVVEAKVESPALHGIDSELADIVMKALERSLNERYQGCDELADALDGWMHLQDRRVSHRDVVEMLKGFFPDAEKAKRRAVERALNSPEEEPSSELRRLTDVSDTSSGRESKAVETRTPRFLRSGLLLAACVLVGLWIAAAWDPATESPVTVRAASTAVEGARAEPAPITTPTVIPLEVPEDLDNDPAPSVVDDGAEAIPTSTTGSGTSRRRRRTPTRVSTSMLAATSEVEPAPEPTPSTVREETPRPDLASEESGVLIEQPDF